MTQARLDEDAVARPHAAGVEGGEEERADHAAIIWGVRSSSCECIQPISH
jgi:hypothetical protein